MNQQIKIALLMATSLFMEILDGTIVTTALPKLAKVFQVSSSQISLLISVYMIFVAIFIPMSGWLAQRYGKRKVWLFAIGLFTLSSFLSMFAPNFTFLIAMRVLQGISGALMVPTARLIVLEKTPANQMLKMTSYFVWPALIAPALAPIVGGLLITYLSWHWIFLINIPIGIFAIIVGNKLLAKDTQFDHSNFDWVGFLEIAVASVLVVVGANLLANNNLTVNWIGLTMIIISVVLVYFSYKHLVRKVNPLFSIKALKTTSFRIAQTSGSVLWLSVGAMPFLLTTYLQNVFNWSAITAGSYVVFIFIGNIGIKPFTSRIISHFGYKTTLQISFIMVLLSAASFAWIHINTSSFIIMILALLSGVGRSLALTAINAVYLSEVTFGERNGASTFNSVTSSLAQGIGISLVTTLVHFFSLFSSENLAYGFAFLFLGIIMIFPIIEISRVQANIGISTIKS